MSTVRDVIIIGSGPAGLTAAIYTARANLHPLMIEGAAAGGQLMLTTEVENYPGFTNGIMGPEMMQIFRDQALRFGTEMITMDVDRVDLSSRPFAVEANGEVFHSNSLIVSTGATAQMLGLPSEQRLLGHGVSTCATCDGFFFRDVELAVVGGGDSALEEAIFLARFASKVTVIHRRAELRASKIMQDRAMTNPKLAFIWNTVVEDILGDGKVRGLTLRNVITNERSEFSVAGLFVAIGHVPNTSLFVGQLDLDAAGYIVTQDGSTQTSVEGVFAAGDVQDHVYRQAVTAAGSGCMAAIDTERFLEILAHAEAHPSAT